MTSLADSSSPLLLSINGDSRALSSLLPTQAPHLSSSPLHCSTPSFVAFAGVRRSLPEPVEFAGVCRSSPEFTGATYSLSVVEPRSPSGRNPSIRPRHTHEPEVVGDPNLFYVFYKLLSIRFMCCIVRLL
uniref:Uncharacterized protein n=1 Tax=Zea mays TaxID=4577 RepID=C0PPD8_MAIZE|nr:unknown [Zea mays]